MDGLSAQDNQGKGVGVQDSDHCITFQIMKRAALEKDVSLKFDEE